MKTLGVYGNPRYHGLADVVRSLENMAAQSGFSLRLEAAIAGALPSAERIGSLSDLNFLVTLGGDGTMLRGARAVAGLNVPVLGVNLGRLGFLTFGGVDQMAAALQHMAEGDFVAQERMTLQVRAVDSAGVTRESWVALNDVVVHKGGFARVVRLRVEVNGEPITSFAADGLVVATPTGSTAYSLSAGGPIVMPSLDSIILTPISAHSLTLRPLVIPPSMHVKVVQDDGTEADELLVTVDGQVGTTLQQDDQLVVSRSDAPVIFVRLRGSTFFHRLRNKLGWGGPLGGNSTS